MNSVDINKNKNKDEVNGNGRFVERLSVSVGIRETERKSEKRVWK